MRDFYVRNRFWISLLANLLFWLATCFFFARFSLLRPLFHNHIYEEFVCVALIALIVYSTRWLTIPYLFNRGRYRDFWLTSLFLLLFSTTVEILLMKSNMQYSLTFNSSPYLLITYTLIFLRNSCFFAWFLVLDLYSSLKATYKKKQQVSVLEHQTVQFSLPDNIEASFPLNKILYIQKNGHTTQLHCVDNEVFTISDPFSYCKETIPSSLWTLENGDKMVFHQHLTEYIQSKQKPEIQKIKTVVMLTKRQFQIYKIIQQNPGCRSAFIKESLSDKCGLRTIERDISSLQEKQLIIHDGSKKDGGYKTCPDCTVMQD